MLPPRYLHRTLACIIALVSFSPLAPSAAGSVPALQPRTRSGASPAHAAAPAVTARSGVPDLGHVSGTVVTYTVVYTVSASSNDASRYNTSLGGQTLVTNTVMELGTNALMERDRYGAYRFISVTWPTSATLVSAQLRLTAYDTPDDTSMQLRIFGEAADSASAYSTSEDFTTRSLTSSSVVWTLSKWQANQRYAVTVTGPVAEILGRPGWSSGNPIALQVWPETSGFARVWAYDGSASYAAQLVLTYTVPGMESLHASSTCAYRPLAYLSAARRGLPEMYRCERSGTAGRFPRLV